MNERMTTIEHFINKCSIAIEEARRKADVNLQLQEAMRDGVVRFCYQKSDGSVREAIGTLKKDMCPEVKGNGKPTPEHLQIYYDVEKGSWRCFKKDSLLTVKI